MRYNHFLTGAIVVLCFSYLIQLASPLRLNTDAASFLALTASALDGKGFVIDGKPTHFPLGYPLLLAALERSGLACSASIIGLNLAMLAVGCLATAYVLRRTFPLGGGSIALFVILTLSCWVFVKHATLPLSDLPYFGFAMACLAVLRWSIDQTPRWRVFGLGSAIVFLIAAIGVRTVGIALLPAFALACLPVYELRDLRGWLRRNPSKSGVLLALFLAVAAAVSVAVTRSRYFHEWTRDWVGWGELARFRLEDWGELVINTSIAKLPAPLRPIVPVLGAAGAALVSWGAARRARFDLVAAYTLSYSAILLVWPYRDARFWVPVFPFLAAYAWLACTRVADRPLWRRAGQAYVAAFCLLGGIALLYSTRISLSGDRFGEVYGGGIYRGSYRALNATRGEELSEAAPADPKLVQLIRRYGSG